jgi:uncharacterized membrane protein
MIGLYAGIYRVALDLHRRSEAKRRKQATSLAAMAQQTVSHLGTAVIGMTRTAQLDAQLLLEQQQQQQVIIFTVQTTANGFLVIAFTLLWGRSPRRGATAGGVSKPS